MTAQSHRVTCALAWMRSTGATAADAARRYKLPQSTINRALHRAGLPVAKPGRPRKLGFVPSK